MKKIVVGVDLSRSSELAIGHAVDLARRTGAEVVLVMVDVIPDLPPMLDGSSRPLADTYSRSLAETLANDRRALGELRERWTGRGAQVSQLVVDGYADERLAAVAAEVGAELVVVGSHGRTGFKRWLIGSIAERVVRLAEQSVVVARGEAPTGGYQRVVIGTDFSAGANQFLARALPLLAPQARVELVHAWAGPWFAVEPAAVPSHHALRGGLDAALADVAARVGAAMREQGRADLVLQARLLEGPPASVLVDVAGEIHADLVIVGSHGRRGVRRFILGSVAEAAVRHAPCSVLVSR